LPPCPASGQVAVGARDADTPPVRSPRAPTICYETCGRPGRFTSGSRLCLLGEDGGDASADRLCRYRWSSVGCSIAGRGCGSGRAARAIPVGAGTRLRGRGDGAGRTSQLAPHPEHQQARLGPPGIWRRIARRPVAAGRCGTGCDPSRRRPDRTRHTDSLAQGDPLLAKYVHAVGDDRSPGPRQRAQGLGSACVKSSCDQASWSTLARRRFMDRMRSVDVRLLSIATLPRL
jgi:hypothetical protein